MFVAIKACPVRYLCFVCSYKEDSDDMTDSDDIIEQTTTAQDEEAEYRETIERCIDIRIGRKTGRPLAEAGEGNGALKLLLQAE